MKALTHALRPHAGFEWEDRIAGKISRMGHEVKQMPRNFAGYDLLVDDTLRIDVKACIHTSYKGSDGYNIAGWVFSNLHNPPTCDMYVLVCLDRTRKEPQKFYIIPSNVVMQRTVTITKRDKYLAYKNAWSWIDKMLEMKKDASLIPISFTMPQATRRDGHTFTRFPEEEETYMGRFKRFSIGLGGSTIGYYLAPRDKKMHGSIIGSALASTIK